MEQALRRARRDGRTTRLLAAALGLGALTSLVLAGCTPSAPTPTPSVTAPSSSATPEAPADPELDPEGSADDNLAYFDLVNQRLIAAGGDLGGRAFIDNLVAAGFEKADMEVTPDRTSVDLQADSVVFSVRINGGCLIGQYGNVGYVGEATTVIGTGRCLIATTRPIDW